MEYIKIGQIVNTHGLDGQIKLNMYTENLEDIKKYNIYLEKGKVFEKLNVLEIKKHKNQIILNIENIDNIEKAESLKNKYVYIKDSEMREKNVLNKNEYFIKDLIGLEVVDEDLNKIGILKDVLELYTDVYVIERENKKDLLVPAIKQYVKEINIKEHKMKIKLGNLNEI